MPRRSTRVAATTTFGSSRDLVFGSSQPLHTGTCLLTEFITRKSKMANGYSSCRSTSCLSLTGILSATPDGMERSLLSFQAASEKCVISRWLECTTSYSHGGGDATRCFFFDDILLLCAALLCLRSGDLVWYRTGGVSKSLHIGREVSKCKNRYFTGRLRSNAEDRTQSPRCRTARS